MKDTDFAALTIGVMLGVLIKHGYSDTEILRMLQRKKMKEALLIVKNNETPCKALKKQAV